jgi:hypothetical protein
LNLSINNVVFFNHLRNGDVHLSRGFLAPIVNRLKKIKPTIKFYYAHHNDPGLLEDQKDIMHSTNYWDTLRDEYMKSLLSNDTLFLSTWYAAGNRQYLNRYGISFDCLYELFDDHCKTWFGFALADLSSCPIDFFPCIDYSKLNVSGVKDRMAKLGRCVLVCNGQALSGQAININLTKPTSNLARKYPHLTFILTNEEGEKISGIENVVYSSDLIKKEGSDLNETSYLSTFCPIIIGRSSGAYTFSFTKDNVMNAGKTFISFSTPTLGERISVCNWLGPKFYKAIEYGAKVLGYDTRNSSVAEEIIDKIIGP